MFFPSLTGISGDWKNHFSPEQEEKFSAAIKDEMRGSNIQFPWDEDQPVAV